MTIIESQRHLHLVRRFIKFEGVATSDAVARGVAVLVEADLAVTKAEQVLKDAKAHKRKIETDTLLALFDEADVNEVTLPNGAKAKRTTLIEGSLPKPGDKKSPEENQQLAAQRKQAFDHIINVWKVPELIKCDVLAHFDKGEHEAAIRLYDEIKRMSNSADVALIEDIHPQTLQAEVRRRLVKGEAVPTELLGITVLPAIRLTKKPCLSGLRPQILPLYSRGRPALKNIQTKKATNSGRG